MAHCIQEPSAIWQHINLGMPANEDQYDALQRVGFVQRRLSVLRSMRLEEMEVMRKIQSQQ